MDRSWEFGEEGLGLDAELSELAYASDPKRADGGARKRCPRQPRCARARRFSSSPERFASGCVWLHLTTCLEKNSGTFCVWLRVVACGCVWLRLAAGLCAQECAQGYGSRLTSHFSLPPAFAEVAFDSVAVG